ncbi:hypothetical protein BH11PSE12_BH11PSE12_26740 [soil metagenome]
MKKIHQSKIHQRKIRYAGSGKYTQAGPGNVLHLALILGSDLAFRQVKLKEK